MKTASLLLAFPLLLPVCTAFAAPREIRADGQYEFLEGGKKLRYTIAKDEVYRRNPKQGSNRVFLSGRKDARGMQAAARQLSDETGDMTEMVAYPAGQTSTDDNRRVVSRSVTLKLAEGVDPMVVASAVNAVSYRSLFYAPGVYAFIFQDGQTALSAAEDLKKIEGISEVTVELARKYKTKAVPTFSDPLLLYATTGSQGQPTDIWYDFYNQVTMQPGRPWPFYTWMEKQNVKNYQWYLYNTGGTTDDLLLLSASLGIPLERPLGWTVSGVPIPEPLRDLYPPDILPKFAVPNEFCVYPPYFDQYADINVFGAWGQINSENGDAINGKGVTVAIMDDGIQVNHEELSGGLYNKNRSYNFLKSAPPYDPQNSDNFDPTPPYSTYRENHGTGMAGIIFARANGKGLVGIAHGATMLGYRFAENSLEPSAVADMMAWGTTRLDPPQNGEPGDEWRRNQPYFDVSVNGWGDSTSGTGLNDMPNYFKKALAYGVTAGRDSKGVIYVFPAGNEGASHGDSNYAYTSNSIYSIHVGAVSDLGRRMLYSSPGASVHVVAPSSGGEMMPAILRKAATGATSSIFPADPLVVPLTDTDRALGYTVSPDDYDGIKSSSEMARPRNTAGIVTTDSATSASTAQVTAYNKDFSGTSASTAMVGGVVALMLQANPNLGWRDVQEILMRSAKIVDPLYGEWSYNAMGMPVSHKYGAGLVDAARAVAMAKVWINLGGRAGSLIDREYSGEVRTLGKGTIKDDSRDGLLYSISPPSIRVEQVVVQLKISHTRPGDLGIILSSPAEGQADTRVESYLYIPHRENTTADIPSDDSDFYEFTTVRHWGTSPDNPPVKPSDGGQTGGWQLKIWDNTNYGKTGGSGSPAPPAADPNSTKLEDGVFVDRVLVPVANNTKDGSVVSATLAFHGSAEASGNLSPLIGQGKIIGRPGRPLYVKMAATTDLARAPMERYYFKVLGNTTPAKPSLFTSPNTLAGYFNAYPEPGEGGAPITNNPSFRFDPHQGILTNVVTPDVIPDFLWAFGTGEKDGTKLTMHSVEGLHKDMYVVGPGVGRKAQIADINAETGEITLTVINSGNVNDWLRFTDFGPATGVKDEFTVKMTSVDGLKTGMYVLGTGVNTNARIASIDSRTKILTLTTANLDNINDVLFFSELSYFKNPPVVIRGTGDKNARTLKLSSFEGLSFRDYVSGKGVGAGAQIVGVASQDEMTVTVSVPNTDVVDGELSFSDVREFEPLVKGNWNVELSATNLFGTTRKQVELEIKDKVLYKDWVNTFYPPITDPNGDPDGDGLSNVWEFVSGGDPYVTDSFQMPAVSVVDGKAVITYQVDANADGIKLVPQISSDLSSWATATVVAGTAVGSITPYTVTLDPSDSRKFFRLILSY